MTSKLSKIEIELLKEMKAQYIKRWNAPIGKRLCTTCNVIQKNDQFTGNLKMCRECTNARHRAYVERYKQAQIEAGVVFRPKGRPRLSESVKKKRAEDKLAEKMAKKEARAKARAKLAKASSSTKKKKKKN